MLARVATASASDNLTARASASPLQKVSVTEMGTKYGLEPVLCEWLVVCFFWKNMSEHGTRKNCQRSLAGERERWGWGGGGGDVADTFLVPYAKQDLTQRRTQ